MAVTTDLGTVVRWFPLVPRPRPPCLPLAERVAHQLTEPAQVAAREPDRGRALALAASVQNQAALLASDCGLPDLAKQICWQQFDAFRTGWPLDAAAARHCLEPIVNMARLQVRAGDGAGARSDIESLYQAVTVGGDATVDGRSVSFDGLTAAEAERRPVAQWLWRVVLAEGVRALARDGRWHDAAAHAERHGGIGRRLLDGRQAAILACCADGDRTAASTLLKTGDTREPWEHAVGACLVVLCSEHTGAHGRAVEAMTRRYLRLAPAPRLHQFQTRLGPTALGFTDPADDGCAEAIARRVIDAAISSGDGQVARDALSDERLRAHLTSHDAGTLAQIHGLADLGPRALAADARVAVQSAVRSSLDTIRRRLSPPAPSRSGHAGRQAAAAVGLGIDDHRGTDAFEPFQPEPDGHERPRVGA
jgi:hypothetical protein